MKHEIFLDRQGNLPPLPNVVTIENEVEFLQRATDDTPVLIRGEKLCAWAEAFYTLRGQPVQVLESPQMILRQRFPSLSFEQVRELAGKIGRKHLSAQEISPVFVLNACFPADYALWQGSPSPQHAARWLLWLLAHKPSEAEAAILTKYALDMRRQAGESPVAELYHAVNMPQAKNLLWRWLGAEKDALHDWGEFPIELPPQWLNAIKEAWMKRIIATNGKFFAEMFSFPLTLALRQELARQAAEYYIQPENAHQLTRAVLRQLQPYLDPLSLTALEEHLPPPIPSALPENETDVLDWFKHQYLPYRRWQARFGDETARQIAVKHAQTFARWLLERYPRWLLDGEHLSFQKSARLSSTSDALILCIILDGLPAWDAEWLAQELSARAPRLTLLQKNYCFTALPTVTEFAKESLLRGVPPRHAPQTPTLGKILPDNRSPHKHLRDVTAGQVWFWRVEQPDKAYHFEQEDKRERQVRAELQSTVDEIEKIVSAIPNTLRLNILLTSDHGRLLNPHSPRQLPVGEGMQAHGRAGWGNTQRNFPENGFDVDEKAGWVELYGERFGMTHNLRLAWGEDSFAHINGTEAFPHGGLFPEEVIVPWFIFRRDAQPPDLEITLTGAGEADMSGEVLVSILNQSPLALECRQISFSHGVTLNGNWNIPPLSERQFKASLTSWPPQSAQGKVTASLLFSQANGATFTQTVHAALQINVLYDRSDDLLKDLDL